MARKARIIAQCRLHIATPSQWLLAKVERSLLAKGMVEARVIPNGVDLRTFRPANKSLARAKLDLPREGPLLVFVAKDGAANLRKDFPTLRAALSRLAPAEEPLHCVVIGREAPAEALANNVVIYHQPPLAAERVTEWLQAADLCVHATKEEAFCLVAAEALACGTPVVATRVGGLPEVVRDGRDGLLVPGQDPGAFAEAIAALLADQSRRESMGNAAIPWAASRFGLDRMIDDYLEWFESVLQTFHARRPEVSRPRFHLRSLFDSRKPQFERCSCAAIDVPS